MKKPDNIVWVSLFVGLGLLSIPVMTFGPQMVSFRKYYGQAEPLVKVIWPLAASMEEFAESTGRRPVSLMEISEFSGQNLQVLEPFQHTFHEEGTLVFYLQVNAHYAFQIDETYFASWVFLQQMPVEASSSPLYEIQHGEDPNS